MVFYVMWTNGLRKSRESFTDKETALDKIDSLIIDGFHRISPIRMLTVITNAKGV